MLLLLYETVFHPCLLTFLTTPAPQSRIRRSLFSGSTIENRAILIMSRFLHRHQVKGKKYAVTFDLCRELVSINFSGFRLTISLDNVDIVSCTKITAQSTIRKRL